MSKSIKRILALTLVAILAIGAAMPAQASERMPKKRTTTTSQKRKPASTGFGFNTFFQYKPLYEDGPVGYFFRDNDKIISNLLRLGFIDCGTHTEQITYADVFSCPDEGTENYPFPIDVQVLEKDGIQVRIITTSPATQQEIGAIYADLEIIFPSQAKLNAFLATARQAGYAKLTMYGTTYWELKKNPYSSMQLQLDENNPLKLKFISPFAA